MNILEHIESLLYQNDCVIVPKFGAFITQKMPSFFREGTSELFPPSKKLSFNASLKQNDGLLVSSITKKEKIFYSQATIEVESLVNTWQRKLEDGEKLHLKNLGVFELSFERKLIFHPDPYVNYLASSFGLEPIKVEKNVFKKSKYTWRYVAACLFFMLFVELRKIDKTENKSLDSLSSIFSSLAGFNSSKEHTFDKNSIFFDLENKVELEKTVELENKASQKFEQFFVIAGVFRSQKRANRLLDQLKVNFKSAAIFKEKKRIYVSYQSYPEYKLAKEEIQKIKLNYKPKADIWLKKVVH